MPSPFSVLVASKSVVHSVLEFLRFEEINVLGLAYPDGSEVDLACRKHVLKMAESMKRSALSGDLKGVNSLLGRGYHPDIVYGSLLEGFMTPLCGASMRGKHLVIGRLLQAGADVNWEDENGATALEFAYVRRYNHNALPLEEDGSDLDETIRLLRMAGGRMPHRDYGDY